MAMAREFVDLFGHNAIVVRGYRREVCLESLECLDGRKIGRVLGEKGVARIEEYLADEVDRPAGSRS